MQLLLNPRRRKRRAASAKRRRSGRRKMSALQRKYFGGGRKRRSSPRRARRSSRRVAVYAANPVRRRRSKRASRRVSRRYRRNPVSAPQIRATLGSVSRVAQNAAVGAAGAIAVDMAMGQLSRFLPAQLASRYTSDGRLNVGGIATKAGVAIALGVLGAKFLPGRMKGFAASGVEGSLTVQAYELARAVLPPQIALGYYNPARVVARPGMARLGAYQNVRRPALRGMGGSFMSGRGSNLADTRVGEGAIS